MNTKKNIIKTRNNLIAVASGKGGVGKTWLSTTLTSLLARGGRKVLLFDGDIGLANVDIQLGLTPARDLGSVIAGRASMEQIITHYDKGGFDIIAGRSGSGSLATLSIDKLSEVMEELSELSQNYDAVILDLGAGVEQHVRYLASLAAQCLVVVTDEPTSLTDAYAFIKICIMENPTAEIKIAVNMATTLKEGEKTYQALSKACETFLKFKPALAGIIRRDPKVKEAIRSQVPLVTKFPSCTAATDAAALSVKLLAGK